MRTTSPASRTAPEVSELVEQWWRYAMREATRFGRRWPWLYDDFESEAAAALFRAAQRFDPARGAFPAYLRMCVWGRLIRRLKVERHANPTAFHPQLPADEESDRHRGAEAPSREPTPAQALEEQDTERWKRRAAAELLRGLPVRDREVFVRAVARGQMQEDIAADLGITRQRVSQILDRARVLLRRRAGREMPDGLGPVEP